MDLGAEFARGVRVPAVAQALLQVAWRQLSQTRGPCFSGRKRSTVTVKNHLNAQNPHLTHYPQMLEELLKYIFMPKRIADAYRAHLATTLAQEAKTKD